MLLINEICMYLYNVIVHICTCMMCIGQVSNCYCFNFLSSLIRLEQFMSDLPHLKIVEVIVKCCCLFIPNDSQSSVSYIAHTYHCTMDDKSMYIL